MNMASEPTLAEVVRRLDEIAQRMDRQDQQHRDYMDKFLLRETQAEREKARDREIEGLWDAVGSIQTSRTSEESWRKNVSLTVIIAVVSGLTTVVLTVIGFVIGK